MSDLQYVNELVPFFPPKMRDLIKSLIARRDLEEIRLRRNLPVQAVYAARDELYDGSTVTAEDCEYLLESFCEHSVYSCEDDMRNGFITLPVSGFRIGISGDVFSERGRIIRFRTVTGFCLRIAHEHRGIADGLCRAADGLSGGSLLIASLPAGGKTTLLRDLARVLSDTYGRKVCIIDERSEIAGCMDFDVGKRTDVLDNCPKSEGMLMALRTLSPDVIITDEIGRAEDFAAVDRALSSGVAVAASIHAYSESDAEDLCKPIGHKLRYRGFLRKNGGKRLMLFHDTKTDTRAVLPL